MRSAARDRCLVVRRVGPSGDDDAGIRYDVEDLAILAALPGSAIPEMALGHWQAPLAQALLPWAVVHASVPAPVVASLHGDGLCTHRQRARRARPRAPMRWVGRSAG